MAKKTTKVKDALSKEVNIPMPETKSKVGKSMTKKRRLRFPQYVVDSYNELKKVTWPSRKETWKLTFAVGMFTMIFVALIAFFDIIIGELIERVLL